MFTTRLVVLFCILATTRLSVYASVNNEAIALSEGDLTDLQKKKHNQRRHLESNESQNGNKTDTETEAGDLLWCGSGGGWRAMAANMGFAHSFSKLGLIGKEGSEFEIISANSGAAWFLLQFAYSMPFFEAVIDEKTRSLKRFVLSWMENYKEIWPTSIERSPSCLALDALVKKVPLLSGLASVCDVLDPWDGDFAKFVETMMASVSEGYGDKGLESRRVNVSNKINPLANVQLNIQTALAPTTRGNNGKEITFVGQKSPQKADTSGDNLKETIRSVTMPIQWEVGAYTKNGDGVAQCDSCWVPRRMFSSLMAHVTCAPETFSLSDYDAFPLFPLSAEDQIKTKLAFTPNGTTVADFTLPFGGKAPSITQIGAATSANGAVFNAGSPSHLAQTASFVNLLANLLHVDASAEAREFFKVLWEDVKRDDGGVCTQWEGKGKYTGCHGPVGHFADGRYADDGSLAQTVGRHQRKISKTQGRKRQEYPPVKVILTNPNNFEDPLQEIVSYWSTEANKGISPGKVFTMKGAFVPALSTQIFEETLSEESLLNAMQLIDGTNITTAELSGTTTNNPEFGVHEGQKVRLFLISTNSNIPTNVVFRQGVETYTEPIADHTMEIASNKVLRKRIQAFLQSK